MKRQQEPGEWSGVLHGPPKKVGPILEAGGEDMGGKRNEPHLSHTSTVHGL